MNRKRVAIIGGTGALGGGLALRFAISGYPVAIGSRDEAKAVAAAEEIAARTSSRLVTGHDNIDAAALAEIVFVAVPFASQAMTLSAIRSEVAGKIVVDTTVPLVPPKVARVQLPERGSAALIATDVLGPDVRLVTGFHNISAHKLAMEGAPGCDVLIFGDDVDARDQVVEICGAIGVPALHGGPLANSIAAEAMTSVLISINKRYRVREGAGIKITGIAET
jgi:hypothetical protein